MENSIEMIWKQGFLNESSMVAPKVNDLYNRKSIQVVERIKWRMKNYRIFNYVLLLVIIITSYFFSTLWHGLIFCTLALCMMWYTQGIVKAIKTINQGATSYDYLKAFDNSLKDVFSKFGKIVRFSLPLYCLIGFSSTWVMWQKLGIFAILQKKHPNADVQLWVLIFLTIYMLFIVLFAGKLYKWEVRIVYGRLFDKLESTIAEMEKLKLEE